MADKCIALVDDDASVLKATSALLETYEYRTLIFSSARGYLDADPTPEIDCLVLDVRMPGMSGLELQAELIERGDPPPIVFITAHGDVPMAVSAIRAGAADFIEKPFTPDQLVDAIEFALEYVPFVQSTSTESADARALLDLLTDRESEVFEQIVLGETTKSIARILGISPRTVDVHRLKIREKLKMARLADLIRLKQVSARR